ncbi:MAG TPA: GlsB/YeaQ/YmgE family stress response membrane protein [Prolixibacteraceae bacterium]|nr:GlsB/YeaQ/YmgE family stress response membrane protein [Prolixibacteraceae bacterium]
MLYVLLIGLVAGAIAGALVRGKGYGCLLNIVIGVIGAYIGNWLLREMDIHVMNGLFGTLITAVIGAVVFLFVVNLIRKMMDS